MKHSCESVACSFLFASIQMKVTPMIDEHAPWKRRFRLHQYTGRLARCNHQRGLVKSNQSGIYQLYAWDVLLGKLHQLTDCPAGKERGAVSSDGRYFYYLNDNQGDETGHFVRINVDTDELIDLTPDAGPYSQLGIQTDCTNKTISYITADSENGSRLFTQSVMNASIGKPILVYQTSNFIFNPVLSYNGELIVIGSMDSKKGAGSQLLVFDTTHPELLVATLDDGADVNILAKQWVPLPNDSRILASSNRSGVQRPFIWNVHTGVREDLALDQLGTEGDIELQDWSLDGKFILLTHIRNATFQLYRYSLSDQNLKKLTEHPSGTIYHAQFGPNDTILVQWENSNAPQQLIALNGESGAFERVMLGPSKDDVPPSHSWRSITFSSSDGQLIQGWVALPDECSHGPVPTIIHMHGGPQDVASDRFDCDASAWLDHGFAYLTINYRGSITFGRAFQNQVYYDIGHWELEDILAARTWIIEEGIALPKAIFLTGWSYGGYLTLLALGKRPDLWAGGIARGAIADWTIMYEDSAESLRGYQLTLFGGTPDEKRQLYESASPMTYIEQIIAPILVIQANDDTRCPARQMQNYEIKMRQFNKDFEIEWHAGGHYLNNTEQSISHVERMLFWAQRVLSNPFETSTQNLC